MLEKANLCKTRSEMKIKFSGYYDKIIKKKWQNYCFKNLPVCKKHKGYTYKECLNISKKCKNKHELYLKHRGVFAKCVKKNWLKLFFNNSYKTEGYTFNDCLKKAKKLKTKQRFKNNFPNHYNRARKKGWLNRVCSHMVCGTQLRSISKKDCLKMAMKCQSRYEFCTRYTSHYNRALKQKWLNEVCSHMVSKFRKFEQKSSKLFFNVLKENNIEVLFHEKIWKDFKSRPDFVVTYKDKIFIIELKDDRSFWKSKDLQDQVKKYDYLGKSKFKNFEKTVLVSPKGKYGYSFNEFLKYLKNFN